MLKLNITADEVKAAREEYGCGLNEAKLILEHNRANEIVDDIEADLQFHGSDRWFETLLRQNELLKYLINRNL